MNTEFHQIRSFSKIKYFALFFMFLSAYGAKALPKFAFKYCDDEKEKFCKDKNNFFSTAGCLESRQSELSPNCRAELDGFIELRKKSSAWAASSIASFGVLNAFGPPVSLVSYNFRYSPKGSSSSPSLTDNKVAISSPVYKSEQDSVVLGLGGGHVHFGNSITLDSGIQLPPDLYRIDLSTNYSHKFSEDKNWSMRASVGYAGDKPFKNPAEITYSINTNYSFKGSENGRWTLGVFFSNNSIIGNFIPIPGVTYFYMTEKFTGLFGFPITALRWAPVDPWTFSVGFFGPSAYSEIGYGKLEKLNLFTGYYWTRQNYIPNERIKNLDRITIEEMKIAGGLRKLFFTILLGELQFGQAFNRSAYISNGLFGENEGVAFLDSEWYVSAGIKAKFN